MKLRTRSQRPAVPETHGDVLALLKVRPKLSEMLWLPWWYNGQAVIADSIRRKAKKENPPGPFCLAHARLLAACRCDRKYMDVALDHVLFDTQYSNPKPWIQAYFDVGLTLCDLGYSPDGIPYMEKAIALETRPCGRTLMRKLLCFRLNGRVNLEKRIELGEILLKEDPEENLIKEVLAKAYMDAGRLDEAEYLIKDLVKDYAKAYGFLMAELCFARKDFQAAMRAFDQYGIHRRVLHFWLPEYDYKKALAYHYCNQRDKCLAQALRIRRRLKWDKFYRLDAIEKTDIERVPAVDEIIGSNEPDNAFFDWDKTLHYLRALRCITRLYAAQYWHIIVLLLVILVVFFRRVGQYL